MSTDIVKAAPVPASLPDMVRYAQHLADANLLPGQYRKQPANVLYAMEYGRTLGITPIAAITGIHVIEGKPSASAGLISGLVRRAGHILRVTGNGLSATAQIIRSDDPDFTYEVTWELKRNERGNPNAEDAGLLGKKIWQQYGASMLKSRAITQVARDACEDVLFGLHYTPEELGALVDQDGMPMPGVQVDPWASDMPIRDWLSEAEAAVNADAVRALWVDARAAGVIREVLDRIAEIGREKAVPGPIVADAEAVEAELVAETGGDERAAAVDALRAAAMAAGIVATLDTDFQQSYGMPIADASIDSLLEMTGLLESAQ